MSEVAEKRSRRGGGRDARRTARSSNASKLSAPYLVRNTPLYEILSDEGAEIIEYNAETILEEVGIEFKDDPEALEILKEHGADVQGQRVHFPRGMCREYCQKAPSEFTQHARNSARSVSQFCNMKRVIAPRDFSHRR